MKKKKRVAYFVCAVPTEIHARMSRRVKLIQSLKEAQSASLELRLLSTKPVFLTSLKDAYKLLHDTGLPSKPMTHSAIWMFHPLTDKYYPVGNWSSGEFVQFSEVLHYNKSGEVGVNLSFYKTMIEFLETNIDYCLWFEDDVELTSNWQIQFENLLDNLPDEFDVINLALYNQLEFPVFDEAKFGSGPFVLPYVPFRSHCILMSRKGAEKYIEFIQFWGSILPLDWILFNVRSAEIAEMNPVYFTTLFVDPESYQICPWSEHYSDFTLTTIRADESESTKRIQTLSSESNYGSFTRRIAIDIFSVSEFTGQELRTQNVEKITRLLLENSFDRLTKRSIYYENFNSLVMDFSKRELDVPEICNHGILWKNVIKDSKKFCFPLYQSLEGQYGPWIQHFPKRLGEVALTVALLDSLRNFVAQDDLEYLLTLEDDVGLVPEFCGQLLEYLQELGKINFDICSFSYNDLEANKMRRDAQSNGIYEKLSEHFIPSYQYTCASILLFSKEGATKIIENYSVFGIQYPIDLEILNIRSAEYPRPFYTTISLHPDSKQLVEPYNFDWQGSSIVMTEDFKRVIR